jgi:hypothetical protein
MRSKWSLSGFTGRQELDQDEDKTNEGLKNVPSLNSSELWTICAVEAEWVRAVD